MERSSPDTMPGLRERRRVRVKLMVQAEALKLFADKGYEQTTIDDIAHASAMSPRTFFRYFPTKEDVVLWDEYDELSFAELLSNQGHEDPLVRLITTVRQIIAGVHDRDRDLLLARTRLSFRVPCTPNSRAPSAVTPTTSDSGSCCRRCSPRCWSPSNAGNTTTAART
jgi:AcrR family transcriptional regulator